MASAMSTVQDCCDDCVCTVVNVEIPCQPSGDGNFLTVLNISALRLVLSNQRTPYMTVRVLSQEGDPVDGTGFDAVFLPDDYTPDGPPLSTRPADILDDSLPGRFRQF